MKNKDLVSLILPEPWLENLSAGWVIGDCHVKVETSLMTLSTYLSRMRIALKASIHHSTIGILEILSGKAQNSLKRSLKYFTVEK